MIPIRRCDCGYGTVTRRPYCPKCRGTMREAETEPRGTVLSWTILHVVPEGFEAPLGLALVGLAGGMNAVARFDPRRPLEEGAPVRLALRDGVRWISA